MKHTLSSTVGVACLIEPRARAVRFRNKMGEGKISTAAMALILARSGEPIFRNTGFADARCWYSSDLAANEFSHAEEPRKHVNQIESSTAVQHLRKALFLSKPARSHLSARHDESPKGPGLQP